MRSDRLKQVMQEIDPNFDEKNLGMAKFSRFVQEAGQRGLLKLTRLENGQMEVDVAAGGGEGALPRGQESKPPERERRDREKEGEGEERRGRRGRRGGRGRDRERGERPERETREQPAAAAATPPAPREAATEPRAAASAPSGDGDMTGERLTRSEAFDLVRRTLADVGADEDGVLASDLRTRARQVLGRDSESLSERNFLRILRDAHDADVIDLRKRGNDYEVSPAVNAAPIADQLAPSAGAQQASDSQAARSAATATALRRGMRPRGARGGRGEAPPPELLTVGVVEEVPSLLDEPSAPTPEPATAEAESAGTGSRKKSARKSSGGRGRKKAAAKSSGEGEAGGDAAPAAKAKRGRARKKKSAAPAAAES